MTATILGVTGYVGSLLLRLLLDHSGVNRIIPVSRSSAGQALSSVVPNFAEKTNSKLGDGLLFSSDEASSIPTDVVFSALPPLSSAVAVSSYINSTIVIDLSADFRIRDPELFALAYGCQPPRPDLLSSAVYGLSEWYRNEICRAHIIANPGCYPTAVLLPLLPLVDADLLCSCVVTNAMSGITGAGRKVSGDYLFTELSENVRAYSPGRKHRHHTEIVSQINHLSESIDLVFIPHLVPMRRGLAVTTVATLREPHLESQVTAILENAYANSPFVKLTGDRIPATAEVRGSNRCDIGWQVSGSQILLFSVIDNLVKGAAGQAVQNMNLRFRLSEVMGLQQHAES